MFWLRISAYFVFTLYPQDQFPTLLLTLLIRSILAVYLSRLILSTIFLQGLFFAKKRGKRGFIPKKKEENKGSLNNRGKRGGAVRSQGEMIKKC